MSVSPTTFYIQVSPNAKVFYILGFAASHFANQIQPVHQQIWLQCLISALITGSVFWLRRKKGELICLLRLSKHLWVADKNTQEAMHPEMMKPHIPLLAQDQISSGLRLPQFLRSASLSSFSAVSVKSFQFHHFKAEKGSNSSSFC